MRTNPPKNKTMVNRKPPNGKQVNRKKEVQTS